MPTITIHRKGYTRKDGVRVKASTFQVKDKGARGRTPKSERWYAPKVHSGWEKGMPLTKRRGLVLRAHKGDVLASARAMQALANITTDTATRRAAQSDAKYFYARNAK